MRESVDTTQHQSCEKKMVSLYERDKRLLNIDYIKVVKVVAQGL